MTTTKTHTIVRKSVVLDNEFTNDWGFTYAPGTRINYGKGAHSNCTLVKEGLALKGVALIPSEYFHLEEERETITTTSVVETVRV